jgi:hypothetical protein
VAYPGSTPNDEHALASVLDEAERTHDRVTLRALSQSRFVVCGGMGPLRPRGMSSQIGMVDRPPA